MVWWGGGVAQTSMLIMLYRWGSWSGEKELAGWGRTVRGCPHPSRSNTGNLQWQQLQNRGNCHTFIAEEKKTVRDIQLSQFLSHLLLLLCVLLQPLPVSLGLLHHLFMGDTWRKHWGAAPWKAFKWFITYFTRYCVHSQLSVLTVVLFTTVSFP